jgi:hypothetical protein
MLNGLFLLSTWNTMSAPGFTTQYFTPIAPDPSSIAQSKRDPTRLGEATDAATEALLSRFGEGPIARKMRAHFITADV